MLAVILAGALGIARALGGDGGESLREFLKLNEVLPTAVCDEAFVSKAPTLISGKPGGSPSQWAGLFTHSSAMGEAALVSFLMEDAVTLAGSASILALWESERKATPDGDATAKLRELRRRVSL